MYPTAIQCCDLLCNQRSFKKPLTISDQTRSGSCNLTLQNDFCNICLALQDYISRLPRDCISSIFEYFNHDDLDAISCVNQTIGAAVIEARAKTKKREAGALAIFQRENGDVGVHLTGKGSNYYMRLKKAEQKTSCVKYPTSDTEYLSNVREWLNVGRWRKYSGKVRKLPCCVYERVRYLTDRFNISELALSFISIDRKFLIHCEIGFACESLNRFLAVGLSFHESFEIEDHITFINWIGSNSPQCIDFYRKGGNVKINDAQFLEQIFRAGSCTKIFVGDSFLAKKNILRYLPISLYSKIAKLESFIFHDSVITADHIMNVVFERLKLQKSGRLLCCSTTKIDQAFIQAATINTEFVECDPIDHASYAIKPQNMPWTASFFWLDKYILVEFIQYV